MEEQQKKWGDRSIEKIMGNLLRSGVIIAAAIVLAGGIYYLLRFGSLPPHFAIFKGEPAQLRHLTGIFQQAFTMHHEGVMQLGIVFLIATPVARVLFSVIAFILEKDFMYTVFTLIVFSILAFSLFGGH